MKLFPSKELGVRVEVKPVFPASMEGVAKFRITFTAPCDIKLRAGDTMVFDADLTMESNTVAGYRGEWRGE